MKRFKDNSVAPIVAVDFDDTISIGGHFPQPGTIRKFAKEVINFMVNSGIKVVIYTSRDTAINQDTMEVHDDITPAIKFLNDNGVKFSSINKSVQFAPFSYNSRKIYAHMYVDDRGFGWIESACSMIYVLHDVLTKVVGVDNGIADKICGKIARGEGTSFDEQVISGYIDREWNKGI